MKKISLVIILLFGIISSYAQVSLNIDALSDVQLKEYVKQANLSGLSDEELTIKAKERGLNDAQITKLKLRIQSLGLSNQGQANDSKSNSNNNNAERLPIAVKPPESKISSKVFGAELFGNQNLTFEPNLKIASPVNYVLGVGDELKIDVFGFSEKQFSQKINTEGFIRIPYIAPIYVAGLTVEDAKKKIKTALTKIYSQIATGRTAVDVTVGQIRSIKVTLIGEVTKPGSYTLPSFSTIMNALYVSGGPNEIGSMRKIELVRNGKVKSVFDVYDFLLKADLSKNTRLEDEDIIKIYPYKTRVEVTGSIKRPAIFEPSESDKLNAIIEYAGGFNDNAFKEFIKLERFGKTLKEVVTINENNFQNFNLKSGDVFQVMSVDSRLKNRVSINGAVYFGGNYSLDEIKTLKQLLLKAKIKEEAFTSRGLIRRLQENYEPTSLDFSLTEVLSDKQKIDLQREDEITIYSINQTRETFKLSINGEVNKPGTYDYSQNLTVEDLILMAGGLKESSSLSKVEISRRIKSIDAVEDSSKISIIKTLDIEPNLAKTTNKELFILKPFDIVSVRKLPLYNPFQSVSINGEVNYPGTYSILSNKEKVSDIIKRSGGIKQSAFIEGALLLRKTFNSNEDNVLIKNKISILKNEITDTIAKRMVDSTFMLDYKLVNLNLKKILNSPGSDLDIFLADGDILSIPIEPQTVQSFGAVQLPKKIIYHNNITISDLINQSGGYSSNANKRRIYVVHPNGEVEGTKKFLFFKIYPKIQRGSEVYVPYKGEKSKMTSTETVGLLGLLGTLITTTVTAIILSKR